MDWQQIADIDRLIFFLNTKWEKKGLEHPRYLIIDLFKTQAFYLPPERSDCKKANADELGKMLRFLPGETVNEATNLCDGKTYGIVCILKKEGNWDYLAVGNHSDNMHNVYGLPEQSSPKNSIDILVWAHESKDKASTREVHYLWIDYLVSWNISKYGDMQCSMSKHVFPWNTDVKEIRETPFQEVMGKSLRGQYSLLLPAGTCQGVKVSSTGMCSVQFPKSLDVDVLRTIKCVKLDSREVGFGRFFVIRSG
jgi:hypothetical protein